MGYRDGRNDDQTVKPVTVKTGIWVGREPPLTVPFGSHMALTKSADCTDTGRTVSVRPSRKSRVMDAS